MSIGATTRNQQAPTLVHRKPVRGALALPGADSTATAWTGHASRHAGGHRNCSDTYAASFEAIDMPSIALRRRGLNAESP